MSSEIPPRIHVLLARESSAAVVIRRGPSRRVCTLSWDRATDTFRVGQWLKGKIYARRSDLSPDGEHLVYFAMNGRWDSEARGAWTAVSRAPYLKAITIFPKGDCWNGGGLFVSNDHVEISDSDMGPHDPPLRVSPRVRVTLVERDLGECPQIYHVRLQRDGWSLEGRKKAPGGRCYTFEKPLEAGWRLRKHAFAGAATRVGRGNYYDDHVLVRRDSDDTRALDAEWADFDGKRLLWAADGKILAAKLDRDGNYDDGTVLYDLNGMQFERIEAPYS